VAVHIDNTGTSHRMNSDELQTSLIAETNPFLSKIQQSRCAGINNETDLGCKVEKYKPEVPAQTLGAIHWHSKAFGTFPNLDVRQLHIAFLHLQC
jgi:hypothetical protein